MDLSVYEQMYSKVLNWNDEKERKFMECKKGIKGQIRNLDTYRKENTLTTKSFY